MEISERFAISYFLVLGFLDEEKKMSHVPNPPKHLDGTIPLSSREGKEIIHSVVSSGVAHETDITLEVLEIDDVRKFEKGQRT